MKRRLTRKLAILAAAVGLVFANCYAPEIVHASVHTSGAASGNHMTMTDHHHGTDSSICPDQNSSDHGKTSGSKACCLLACSASLFVLEESTVPLPDSNVHAGEALKEVLSSVDLTTSDPPPRFARA